MMWFKNMKIVMKLMLGFIVVALIAGGIGAVGVINIRTIDEKDTYLYTHMTVQIGRAHV